MIVRAIPAALVVAVSTAAALAVAAPAQAAAQPDVTVTSADITSAYELAVYGTVTCTAPTGAAHVSVFATQVMPFSFGSVSLDVPCGSGPVAWQTSVHSSFGWQSFHQVSINAQMTDDQSGLDGFSGNWYV